MTIPHDLYEKLVEKLTEIGCTCRHTHDDDGRFVGHVWNDCPMAVLKRLKEAAHAG